VRILSDEIRKIGESEHSVHKVGPMKSTLLEWAELVRQMEAEIIRLKDEAALRSE